MTNSGITSGGSSSVLGVVAREQHDSRADDADTGTERGRAGDDR